MSAVWEGPDGEIGRAVLAQNDRLRETYVADPGRVEQDANIERQIAEGAYAQRQLYELVQNASDAMRGSKDGRIEIVLTGSTLYAANTGAPVTPQGVEALMATHRSVKRDEQIGRFGLGFKSTLAVTDTPRIFSRSGSFGFDRKRSHDELARLVPAGDRYPAARMAWPLDPEEFRAADPVLAQLMKWAQTVVVLPVARHLEVLQRSMKNFPAEFLLFSPHVGRLGLEDRVGGSAREISLRPVDDGLLLNDAGKETTWVVHTRRHDPSKAALVDGGYHAARATLDVSWAAPVAGRALSLGVLWSYFPTSSIVTLSGIVNAPWKLAEDRESLLEGKFNQELLTSVLPAIVADSLATIHRPDRPLAVLDVLPARGKESRSWADEVINEPIMRAVAQRRCIPTLDGTLASPTQVRLHPDNLKEAELELWASACVDPGRWVDHAVASAERRAKVQRLMRYRDVGETSLKDWVQHLAKRGDVEGSVAAIRLVGMLSSRDATYARELDGAKVLLLDDGSVAPIRRGKVFLPGGSNTEGRLVVDPRVAGDAQVDRILRGMGIEPLNEAGALQAVLAERPIPWDKVWPSSRLIPIDEAERHFRDAFGRAPADDLQVRTWSGKWKVAGECFLPGPIIPGDGSRDQDFVVDPRYHSRDLDLLGRLGVLAEPAMQYEPLAEGWRSAAMAEMREAYRHKTQQPRIADESIVIEPGRVAWPLDRLSQLSLEGREAITAWALANLDETQQWEMWTGPSKAHRGYMPDPTWRYLRKHGALRTQAGIQPVSRCLVWDEEQCTIDGVEQPLPFVGANVTAAQAKKLGLKQSPEDLARADWIELFAGAGAWPDERRFLLYAWAAYCEQAAPARIKVRRGRGFAEVPPSEAAVTANLEVFKSLVEADVAAVLAASPEDADALRRWGLARGEDMLVESLEVEVGGEAYAAADRFPPLRNMDERFIGLTVQPCARLEILTATPTGQKSRPFPYRLEGETLFVTRDDDRGVLAALGNALGVTVSPDVVLKRMELTRRNKLRATIAEEPDVAKKLVLAVGVDELRQSVPSEALAALGGGELSDEDIARLAMSVDGYGVLQTHTKTLAARGLEPPSTWAGRRSAREWVRALGFPLEMAGFGGQPRAAEIEVEGPPVLGPLHDYQVRVGQRVRSLLAPDAEVRRGLLALPTGAGKTRIAVQALVESLNESTTDMRVIWLAETDELCEQATQTWLQIWRALGTPGRPLTISRLWGMNGATERDGHQVVVASLAKIDSLASSPRWEDDYGWLVGPAIIVVDEAHKSISQSYNRALSVISGASRPADMTVPLLGLTATPYRGYNEAETETLVGRYHRNRLTDGLFPNDDVYAYLQEKRVLARIRQVELPGADLELTAAEQAHAAKFRQLPDTAEKRLAQDTRRNEAIVNSVLELEDGKSALLFATSVQSARVLAAMLTYRGVEARAISGTTDSSARRRYIEDFKSGKVRVLTNYNVFTEGFDVPGLDAVYITRPTFSPNVYQQMVGRGLRGPLNGGKDEVLIVNVADNLTNFHDEFAFRHFDHLWGAGARS